MASFVRPLVGNVAEAGDVVLFAVALAATLVVGLAILGIDAVVGRLGERAHRNRRRSSVNPEREGGDRA